MSTLFNTHRRFYPLTRRHQISRPRMTPVTRTFEWVDTDCRFGLPDGMCDLLRHFGCKEDRMPRSYSPQLLRLCTASLERLPPGTWKITKHPDGFEERTAVTITTPPRMSEKLRRYFESWTDCPECNGSGTVTCEARGRDFTCSACHGAGQFPEEWEMNELREALDKMLTRYLSLANSGDAGFWNPEEEAEVIEARRVLDHPPETTS